MNQDELKALEALQEAYQIVQAARVKAANEHIDLVWQKLYRTANYLAARINEVGTALYGEVLQ